MRPLSAIDAIGPAWKHTGNLLLAPRRWQLALKIGAVAFFAQMGGCNTSFGGPGGPGHAGSGMNGPWLAAMAAAFLIIGLIGLAIGLVLFYIGSRLQFVLFEVVLRGDTTVAPIWRRYGSATWRWMGLKLLLMLVMMICIAPFVIPIIIHFVHSLPANGNPATDQLAGFIAAIFAFIGIIFLVCLVFGAAFVLLRDFGMPFMALESTTLAETVRRVVGLFRAEPGQFLLYLLMYLVMAIAGAIAAEFALGFLAVICALPLGGAAFGMWAALHQHGITAHVMMIGSWVLLGLLLLTVIIIAAMMLLGYVYTFLQAYALFFLGGRYPLVGSYMEVFLPPPVQVLPPGYAYPPQQS